MGRRARAPLVDLRRLYGNRCRRLELPEGTSTVSYDGLVEIDPEPGADARP